SFRPLLVLPIVSTIFCFLISVIILGGGLLVLNIPIRGTDFSPATPRVSASGIRQLSQAALSYLLDYDSEVPSPAVSRADRSASEYKWPLLLTLYLVNYAVIAYFNVALASIVLDRLAGGSASLD